VSPQASAQTSTSRVEDGRAGKRKKTKRSAEQRAKRKARKAERLSKRRAERRAASAEANATHNPPKDRESRAEPESPPIGGVSEQQTRRAAPDRPARKSSEQSERKVSRPSSERSKRSRVAIGVLLAVGLMLGFWLLFKIPAPK
jgi:cobalamin biosynthesis Mg chelatase CobN